MIESKEFMEGWNANNDGKHRLSSPYSVGYNHLMHAEWIAGYDACQERYNDGDGVHPGYYSIDELARAKTIVYNK